MAGNPNPTGGKPDKLIRDALKAAIRQDPSALKRIAEKWVIRAEDDQTAANALADRLDGKAPQAIIGGDEDDPAVKVDARVEIIHVHSKPIA